MGAAREATRMGAKPPPQADLVPDVRPPRPPMAEIQLTGRRVIVTVPLQELGIDQPAILITPTAIRLGSPSDALQPEFVILLPATVDPRQYRASVRNGVLDLMVARWMS
jgi:hypothetical protein